MRRSQPVDRADDQEAAVISSVGGCCRGRPTSYPMCVVTKTSVYLDDEDKRRLGDLARRTGVSEAALLRQGVRRVLDESERPRPSYPLGRSTDGRTAADSDEALRELGFGR